jgi:3'-5' exoribonuclease
MSFSCAIGESLKIYVKDLKGMKEGTNLHNSFIVLKKEIRSFADKPGNYLSLILSDKTGMIESICWDDIDKIKQFSEDDIISFKAKLSFWKGEPRLILEPQSIEKLSSDSVDWREFVPSTEKDVDKMAAELFGFIASIGNQHLQNLLKSVFEDKEFLEAFKSSPAAVTHHHNYLGGLLEHTVSVAKICDSLIPLYPELDRNVLIAGALLHDLGKTREYKWKPRIDITTEGGFAGHPALGAFMISKKFPQNFPEDLKIRIYHMILSHHGEGEFGAVVPPKFKEAYALHLAENLDAKLREYISLEKKLKETNSKKGWSYAKSLGRYIYAGEFGESGESKE